MYFIVTVLVTFALSTTVGGDITKVNVDVYYEALCPFARKFISNQLYKALQTDLSKYINLTLIPYGKAKTSCVNGACEFTCHHGPNECYGNKIQACALSIIDDGNNTRRLGYNKVTLGFINCLMSTQNPKNTSLPNSDECARANNVNYIQVIKDCAEDVDGSLYLAKLGNQTRSFQNPLANVPSVVFSEEYKKEESDLAENDFIKALCAKIQGEKPAECYKNGTQRLTVNIGILLITIFTCYIY